MTVQSSPGVVPLDLGVPGGLEWRCIGPFRGGRAVAVVGHPTERQLFYMGCAGGVWKTEDGGVYWENISDGFFQTSAVGALAISESDPNVLYAGMGESCIAVPRLHWTSQADGVYRSTDGGRTWVNVGLRDSQHISRIRVHPGNPLLVYVAVVGHLEGRSSERGVYRSEDGGETWEQVLYRDDDVGCNDLSMDPANPRILYAGMWQVRRSYWNTYSGGSGTSLYRSTDGGDSWTDITDSPGITAGLKGRFAVSASGARSGLVWALCDGADTPGVTGLAEGVTDLVPGTVTRTDAERGGGLLRSDDHGSTWERVSDYSELTVRPYYYNHVFAHPQDPDTVYVLNQPFWKSVDGGRSFKHVGLPHPDTHDLWIDPNDPDRMVHANDGGACVSFNGGETWSSVNNQPTTELYHVTTDDSVPYKVYGTIQDGPAICVPSRSNAEAIRWQDCYEVGTAESGHIAVYPEDSNIIFSGALGSSAGSGALMLRYDHRTGQQRLVTVWPDLIGLTAPHRKYRFEWDSPIVFSPHDSNVLYAAGNVVFRSTDEGASWAVISPDLTRNDLAEREKIDPVTNIAPFERCAIFRLAESSVQRGVIWVGTNDGLVQLTCDGGESWKDVTPPGLPEWTPVSSIDPSPHDPATAYVSATAYQHGDYRPYLYKTSDYGTTWQTIVHGIREMDFTRVIRADTERPGLLYAGTERGVYVSFDDGAGWQPLQLNLPKVPVHDMVVKRDDLVAATHGRGFWILDNLSPLRQLTAEAVGRDVHLFNPAPAYRYYSLPFRDRPTPYIAPLDGRHKRHAFHSTYWLEEDVNGRVSPRFLDAGRNPPDGAAIDYHLSDVPREDLSISFLDSVGRELHRFSSRRQGSAGPARPPQRTPAERGLNRFIWDLRVDTGITADMDGSPLSAPMVPPGRYTVVLDVDGHTCSRSFDVRKDLRSTVTDADLTAQYDLLLSINERIRDGNRTIRRVRDIRAQVDAWESRSRSCVGRDRMRSAAQALRRRLDEVETPLLLAPGGKLGVQMPSRGAFTVFAGGLLPRLGPLADTVGIGDGAPTRQAREVFAEISEAVGRQLEMLEQVIDSDVPGFMNIVHELGIPAVSA